MQVIKISFVGLLYLKKIRPHKIKESTKLAKLHIIIYKIILNNFINMFKSLM